ncbi:flavin-containing monooxygenase FMO GS-OX-like 7 [Impatiens glandulifera]|uniref:flavin-containing monooxygenase FMO GS-OX-like 7 n=1 Tax=Impatiens glandulifera TaxID=253017 RepID=UPI001FB18764|nr:flavin-containing monooxygenase FMO GS-OX-like 7 [Impatiens glandulifera]
MAKSVKAAVIGAGVAGLVAARELRKEGHKVTVFEKSSKIGGTWVYDPRIESDPISIDPNREIVHSSLYLSLRTNLPRDLMGFSDYPFSVRENGDPRNYPGHEEFLLFLNDFVRNFEITELIRFNSEVVGVERVGSGYGGWSVEFKNKSGSFETEIFEAVLICNGHQTIPILANPPGMEKWKGKQIHSHNYRVPKPFLDQIVVVIGDGPSGMDISKEIATEAKEVHLSSRSPNTTKISKLEGHDNLIISQIECVDDERGIVLFKDGSSVHHNIIFHCTWYKFDFPFLRTNGIVTVDDNRVGPLYKHVFAPEFGPSLSFLALPTRVGTIFGLVK